ncbi:hypothetical protein [Janibacter sp. GXQ6167]|uniref:hypothetical protein n=1 Tax=Janibacter sp. GXQ6167 TaxID=3240791 RepID=UPI003523BE67
MTLTPETCPYGCSVAPTAASEGVAMSERRFPTFPDPSANAAVRRGFGTIGVAAERALPPWVIPILRRRPQIAFFGYSTSDYDGDHTSQEDIFTCSPVTGVIERVIDDRANLTYVSDRNPSWSPDRTRFIIHRGSETDPTSRLVIVSATSGATLEVLGAGHSPVWADVETILHLGAVGDPDDARWEIFALNPSTHASVQITDLSPGFEITGHAWHPSAGLALALVDPAAGDVSVRVASSAAVAVARAGGVPISSAAVAPIGPPDTQLSSPAFSPDGSRIAVATWQPGQGSRVAEVTTATGALALVPGPSDPTLSDGGPVYSPDGKTLAFVRGYEDEWSEIWLYPVGPSTKWSRFFRRRPYQLTDDARGRFKGALDW